MDEATSSIDTRTEALVQRGMDGLMYGRTSFVIAHRLSTVRNADCIVVLEQGRIIERGSHDELIAKKGKVLSALHRQSGRELIVPVFQDFPEGQAHLRACPFLRHRPRRCASG